MTARLDHRKALLLLDRLMAISGTVVAIAPNYRDPNAGRAFLGVAIGGFWSMSAATVMRLVPRTTSQGPGHPQRRQRVGRAIAAPLGSYVGSLIGWRWAFFCLVPLAADHPGVAAA